MKYTCLNLLFLVATLAAFADDQPGWKVGLTGNFDGVTTSKSFNQDRAGYQPGFYQTGRATVFVSVPFGGWEFEPFATAEFSDYLDENSELGFAPAVRELSGLGGGLTSLTTIVAMGPVSLHFGITIQYLQRSPYVYRYGYALSSKDYIEEYHSFGLSLPLELNFDMGPVGLQLTHRLIDSALTVIGHQTYAGATKLDTATSGSVVVGPSNWGLGLYWRL